MSSSGSEHSSEPSESQSSSTAVTGGACFFSEALGQLATSSSYRYRYPKSARALSELKHSCSTAACDCDCYIYMACVTILTQATLNARDSKKNYITNFN